MLWSHPLGGLLEDGARGRVFLFEQEGLHRLGLALLGLAQEPAKALLHHPLRVQHDRAQESSSGVYSC
jgi:hypothetical protein